MASPKATRCAWRWTATRAQAGWPRPEIHLESGGDTARIRAASEPSIIHDGVFLTADAAADEPVFLRFRRLGWIALWRGDEREPLAAHPQTLPQIERFFAFCG